MATNANAPTKSFIIKHMNTSHADSLSLYLRAYCGVSAHFAHPAILQDISHSDLLITAKGTRYSVPINPPMTSLAETRARVVAMHKDSLQRLGLSDITIAEYRPPQGLQVVSLVLVVATLVVFGRRSNFLPGSAFYETVGLDRYPVFTRFCYDVAPVVVGLLLGSHLVEATLLAVKRLALELLPLPHPQDAGPLWRRPHGLGISRAVVLAADRKRDGDGSQRRRKRGAGEEIGASGVAR